MVILKKEFPNARIDFLRKHPNLGIIAAFGSRTCVVLSHTLEIVQRYLDTNKEERFYCCEFADISQTRSFTGFNMYNSPESLNGELPCNSAQTQEPMPSGSYLDAISFTDDNDIFLGDSPSSIEEREQPGIQSHGEDETENLLLMAGESGIIKVIDLQKARLVGYLRGHTGAVRDLKVVEGILVSCSEDSTIRIWNLHTYVCIGVLGGLFGHKDHVLSIDVNYKLGYIVSVGTDTTVKQWMVNFTTLMKSPYNLIYKPRQNFTNVHRSAITKVAYYGDLIVSLCNNILIAIYNNKDLEKLKELNTEKTSAIFSDDKPIFIGSVDLCGDCKTFIIYRHLLIGLSSRGDVYLFDLRGLSKETSPYIIETKLCGAEDIVLLDEHAYITTGKAVYCLPLDLARFDEHGEW
ncbi:polycomb protein EED [Pancytospora epiphaga]|nr:polycomb protein EED [Pancytospora epiphaga]